MNNKISQNQENINLLKIINFLKNKKVIKTRS